MTIKRRYFSYTDKYGVVQNDIEVHKEDEEYYALLVKAKNTFLDTEKLRERKWRNSELSGCDWMLVPDATYGGELITGSSMYTDIMAYRTALREYNLTTDERPTRPDWYN